MKEVFSKIVSEFGEGIFSEEQRFLGILSDYAPGMDKERRIVKNVMDCGIHRVLLGAVDATLAEKQAAVKKAKYQVGDKLGLSDDYVNLVIDWFVIGLQWQMPTESVIQTAVQVSQASHASSKESGGQDKSIDINKESVAELTKESMVPISIKATGSIKDQPFLMPIDDVFSISGRGTVVTGRIERGTIKLNEKVHIVGFWDKPREIMISGIDMFRKALDRAEANDNVGLQLQGVVKSEIEKGQVLAKPGSIMPLTKFKGQVYLFSKDEAGRKTPIFNYYRPQFIFRTSLVSGIIRLPDGVEMCIPGSSVEIDVELVVPIAIEQGLRFDISEGGRTFASGRVIGIYQ